MRILILTCLFLGLLVVEGRRGGKYRKITYCAWNNETKTNSIVAFGRAVKKAKNGDQAPLHTGECGNCTQANICKNKFMGGKRKICGSDGNDYANKCEFAMARCEAYNKDNTKLLQESCQKKRMCEKLEAKCNNESSSNETYCAWNKDDMEYETVTRGKYCIMHLMKCSQKEDKMPLHKGVCGNCTKENICKNMNPKRIYEMMEKDGDDNDDDDDDDNDENDGNTKVEKRHRRGNKRRQNRVGKKGRKDKVAKKQGKKMGRKVCDEDRNEYENLCKFMIARCTKFALDGNELKRGHCKRN